MISSDIFLILCWNSNTCHELEFLWKRVFSLWYNRCICACIFQYLNKHLEANFLYNYFVLYHKDKYIAREFHKHILVSTLNLSQFDIFIKVLFLPFLLKTAETFIFLFVLYCTQSHGLCVFINIWLYFDLIRRDFISAVKNFSNAHRVLHSILSIKNNKNTISF